jgi:hypothetical protein
MLVQYLTKHLSLCERPNGNSDRPEFPSRSTKTYYKLTLYFGPISEQRPLFGGPDGGCCIQVSDILLTQ